MGRNVHRLDKKEIAEAGGIIILFGFTLGILSYVAIKTFVLKTDVTTIEIFTLLSTILIAGIIGFVDDIFGWIHGGLSAKFRIVLLFFAAIPLMVINAGYSKMAARTVFSEVISSVSSVILRRISPDWSVEIS